MFGATLPLLSKFLSKSGTKRVPLTTKHAGKGFYKGNGCASEGTHTSKGGFKMDRFKMLEIVAPGEEGWMNNFKLKAYVAVTVRDKDVTINTAGKEKE